MSSQMISPVKLVAAGILSIVLLVFAVIAVDIVTVDGHEYAVKETWTGGVEDEVFAPRTYFLWPGWSQEMYSYDCSFRVFVMNDDDSGDEYAEGRPGDSYKVQSSEGQDMKISFRIQWSLDPEKLVSIHTRARTDFEEKLLRTPSLRIIKDQATQVEAIQAYSGKGLVALQKAIEAELTNPEGMLASNGVIVHEFVIEGIELDPDYIGEIKDRQVATQSQLTAIEEQKAAQAEALVAKALAQADYEKQVVEAERDARKRVVAAEAAKAQIVLAAEGERLKKVEEATGFRDAEVLRAEGIKAVGLAEAETKSALFAAWSINGASNFVKVEIADRLAKAYSGVQGFIPEGMSVNVLADGFNSAVEAVVAGNLMTRDPTNNGRSSK